jgi:hypothetical protein
VSQAAHGTSARWHGGCHCTLCRRAHADTQRAGGRARAQKRLPIELRQQLLDAVYAGQPFRTVLRDLGLTSNRVWGLTKTDQEWSEKLEAALMANPPGRPPARHECRVRARLCLQRVAGAPRYEDGAAAYVGCLHSYERAGVAFARMIIWDG